MYSYLKGNVTEILSNYITLEISGVGYLIHTANPYSFNINEEYKIYIYQQVKEDELSLYGFKNEEERDLFLKLISVKGLGCKMALPMLATGSSEGIMDAIERENLLYLKKFPKIGDKLAKQIILDLKGKLASSEKSEDMRADAHELVEVLRGLGYKVPDIKKILPSVNTNETIETQIKEALKLLLK